MFEFHHTGTLVEDIEKSKEFYTNVLGFSEVSETYYIASQKVSVCFVKNGASSYLELVQPDDDNSTLQQMQKKKISYYHVGYLVEDMSKALDSISDNTHLVSRFSSEAFDGKECAFVFTSEMHLIELIER